MALPIDSHSSSSRPKPRRSTLTRPSAPQPIPTSHDFIFWFDEDEKTATGQKDHHHRHVQESGSPVPHRLPSQSWGGGESSASSLPTAPAPSQSKKNGSKQLGHPTRRPTSTKPVSSKKKPTRAPVRVRVRGGGQTARRPPRRSEPSGQDRSGIDAFFQWLDTATDSNPPTGGRTIQSQKKDG